MPSTTVAKLMYWALPGSRSSSMKPSQQWSAMIEAEHAQSERARGEPPATDHWRPYSHHFVADPHRSGDPTVEVLLQHITAQHTIIDVGAGAGRLALPLALHCRRVVAVEPSDSMASLLLLQAQEHHIYNISLVRATWEEAAVEPGDVIICVHVLYTARDIDLFVRKLEAHAHDLVLVVLFVAPPQSQFRSLWKQVHAEERLPLPGLGQFEEVLEEIGIAANVEMLPTQPQRGYNNPEQALEQLGLHLFLAPGSSKWGLLERILPDILEEDNGVLYLRDVIPMEPRIVKWRPSK